MRSFDERIAEINRRSDAILQRRKQQKKRFLTACVPLALCLVVCSAWVLPSIMPTRSNDPSGMPESVLDSDSQHSHTGMGAAVVKIQVSNGDTTQTHTDAATIQAIMAQFDLLDINSPLYDLPVRGEDDEIEPDKSASANGTTGGHIYHSTTAQYAITVTMEKGASVEYRLVGTMLYNKTAGTSSQLTQEQLQRLLPLLGIA